MATTSTVQERLMIIDGHSLAFRAFHALPDTLFAPDGQPVHVVYGFIGMLCRLLEALSPRYLVVAFDGGRSFRHDLYDAYKPERVNVAPEVDRQVALLVDVLDALGSPHIAGEPFEADDFIATLAAHASAAGLDTVVVTGDRDLLALVNDRVHVLYTGTSIRNSVRYDEAAVIDRFGVTAAQLTDYKALVGDPSDNIPGVRGVGAKSAAGLLQRYGDLEGIYDHLPELATGLRVKLETERANAFLSRRLTALRFDAPVELDLDRSELRFDLAVVEAALQKLGIETLLDRLPRRYV